MLLSIGEIPSDRLLTRNNWRLSLYSISHRSVGHHMAKYLLDDIISLSLSALTWTALQMQLAEALVAREADLGFNDTQFLVKTHLGNILHAGDTVMGFDLGRTNFNDADLKALRGYDLPEIVLVRKAYPVRRSQKKKRVWKLKSLTKEQGEERRMDVEKDM